MKRSNLNNNNYTLRVSENGQTVLRCQTHKIGRISHKSQAIQFSDSTKVYLRVNYGTFKDCWGKMTDFLNEGVYSNKKDFRRAYNAFMEEGRAQRI